MRRRDQLSLGAGAAALGVSTLAVGGAPRWAQAIVAALVGIAVVAQVASRRRPTRGSPLLVGLGAACALTALQIVPMPHAILELVDPMGAGLRADSAELARVSPWPCVSLDPAGTLCSLAFLLILLGVAFVALRIAAQERGPYLMLAGVALACALVALVTGIHMVVNASTLYGVYEPHHAAPHAFGPLLNSNHLGCLMALGTTVSLGLALYERQAAHWRALWVAIAVACSAVALVSLSRGAAISLALGITVTTSLVILDWMRRSTGRAKVLRFRQLPIGVAVATGLALAIYASAGNVTHQLANTSLSELDAPVSKFAAWRASAQLIGESPWIGIGRGAFESTFTRIFEPSSHVTFSHLENEYIQAVVDWGIPGAALLAAIAIYAGFRAMKKWRDGPLAAAALGGLAGVAFQSCVDFGIEILGVAVPVTIVAATLLHEPLRESRGMRSRAARLALTAVMFIAALVLVLPITTTIEEDHDDLAAGTPTPADLEAVVARHPLDYLAFGRLSQLAPLHDPTAVRLLNHALVLHPYHPGLHLLAARMLVGAGRNQQAAVEYGLAIDGTLRPHNLLIDVLSYLPARDDAAAAIPIDYADRDVILRSLHELQHDDVATHWLMRVVDNTPADLDTLDKVYQLAYTRGELDLAERAARKRLAIAGTPTSNLMLARVLFQRHDYARVFATLGDVEKWSGRVDQHVEAWLLVCDSQLAQRAWDVALECLHHLDGSGLITGGQRSLITKRIDHVHEQRTSEIDLKQLDAIQRSLHLPTEATIPVSHGDTPAPPRPAIPSPFPERKSK